MNETPTTVQFVFCCVPTAILRERHLKVEALRLRAAHHDHDHHQPTNQLTKRTNHRRTPTTSQCETQPRTPLPRIGYLRFELRKKKRPTHLRTRFIARCDFAENGVTVRCGSTGSKRRRLNHRGKQRTRNTARLGGGKEKRGSGAEAGDTGTNRLREAGREFADRE